MLRAYTLLKTLSHVEAPGSVSLLGDHGRLRTRCWLPASRFLPQPFAQAIDCVAHDDNCIFRACR